MAPPENPPAVISPKPNAHFIDFDPVEVARQLTLIESSVYRAIMPFECLGQAWSKKNRLEAAPAIVSMIKRFNLVSTWVCTEVVKCEKLDKRVKMFKLFIRIAQVQKKIYCNLTDICRNVKTWVISMELWKFLLGFKILLFIV
jgi:son of sevenless-like protein